MIDCMNHLASLELRPRPDSERPLSLDELLEMGFSNPLRAIGLCPEAVAAQLRVRRHGARVQYDGHQFRALLR